MISSSSKSPTCTTTCTFSSTQHSTPLSARRIHPKKTPAIPTIDIKQYLQDYRQTRNTFQVGVDKNMFYNVTPDPKLRISESINAFCDQVERKGISDRLALCQIPGTDELCVFLKPGMGSIQPGAFVALFAGEFKERDNDNYDESHAYRVPLKTKYNKEKIILLDAAKNGNFTRELKHSTKPNVESKFYKVNDIYYTVFYASKLIKGGEQITIDYGSDYLDSYPGVKDMAKTPYKLLPSQEVTRVKICTMN